MDIKEEIKKAVELHKVGKFDEAEAIYRAALKQDPNNVDALHLTALISLQQHNVSEEAISFIERACKLAPKSPFISHNLGVMYGSLGKMDKAEAAIRKAIELNPDYCEAFHTLADMIKCQEGDLLEAKIKAVLDKIDEYSAKDQCFALFAMGSYCNATKRYDEAFEYYHRANAAKGVTYDLEAHKKHMAEVRAIFKKGLFEKFMGCGIESEAPVFIVGMPRSGSTLIENILSAHPNVVGLGEISDIYNIAQAISKHVPLQLPYPFYMLSVDPSVLTGFADSYLSRVSSEMPDALRFVNKTLSNYRYLGLIAMMFPKAKIIHTLRHPLDTCLSCYFKCFVHELEFTYHMEQLAGVYRVYREMMAYWEAVLLTPILSMKYESLVEDQEAQSKKLIEFCGLEWDDACLAFHKTDKIVHTGSMSQVRKPMYKSSVSRYTHYEKHLGVWKDLLKDYIEAY